MTIKQLDEAVLTSPDSPYQVDGHDLTQVVLIACVRTLKEQSNGSDYLLEDGTGTICGHVWANERTGSADWLQNIREGDWVRVFGQLKSMGSTRFLSVNQMRPLASSDELTHHFLAVIGLHLVNTGRFDGPAKAQTSPLNAGFGLVAAERSSFSPIQQAVQQLYRQCQADAGLHINSVVQALRGKYAEGDVRSAVNWLMNEGYLYQTIDNDHARSTE